MSMPESPSRLRKAGKTTADILSKAAFGTCKLVFWICCAPCFLYALSFRPARHRRTCGGVHSRRLDKSLHPRPTTPPPRPRALSLPLISPEHGQITSDQSQSSFMTKFPLEIRRLVYSEMLGGANVHLETFEGRLRARRCNRSRCQCMIFCPPLEQNLDLSLGMLRTCRVIYSEAVEYLYTDNHFSITTMFDSYPTIDYLSYYFLPQRLSRIRNLHIYWELECTHYNNRKLPSEIAPRVSDWNKSWASIQRLSGLRQLHVVIASSSHPWTDPELEEWEAIGPQILAGVQSITAPVDFVVTLPDRRCSMTLETGESKCVFELPAGSTADAIWAAYSEV